MERDNIRIRQFNTPHNLKWEASFSDEWSKQGWHNRRLRSDGRAGPTQILPCTATFCASRLKECFLSVKLCLFNFNGITFKSWLKCKIWFLRWETWEKQKLCAFGIFVPIRVICVSAARYFAAFEKGAKHIYVVLEQQDFSFTPPATPLPAINQGPKSNPPGMCHPHEMCHSPQMCTPSGSEVPWSLGPSLVTVFFIFTHTVLLLYKARFLLLHQCVLLQVFHHKSCFAMAENYLVFTRKSKRKVLFTNCGVWPITGSVLLFFGNFRRCLKKRAGVTHRSSEWAMKVLILRQKPAEIAEVKWWVHFPIRSRIVTNAFNVRPLWTQFSLYLDSRATGNDLSCRVLNFDKSNTDRICIMWDLGNVSFLSPFLFKV